MKVAAIQFRPEFKAKEVNLRKLTLLVKQAADAGARLIVLPELCATGYSFMSVVEAEPLSEIITEQHGSMYVMSELARRLKVYIAWGLITKDYGTGVLHNSQVLVSPSTNFSSYDKVNLWGNDFLWAKPGRANPPVEQTELGNIGLLVCRDVRDKSDKLDSFYEKGDADVVAFSTNWGRGGFPAVQWMDFAQENNTVLVVSNRYGVEEHNDFGLGGTCIILPDGRVNCTGLEWGKDCIVIGDV